MTASARIEPTAAQWLELPSSSVKYAESSATVTSHDGCPLHVLMLTPALKRHGTVLLGHAFLVDRRSLWRPAGDRPSLAGTLLEQGFRVCLPDSRGRNSSGLSAGRGGAASYDDFVQDTGPLVAYIRSQLGETEAIHLLGHSQFGHCSLAWLASNPSVHGKIVTSWCGMGSNPWIPSAEPSLVWRYIYKPLVLVLFYVIAWIVGHIPARKLGIGSQDDSLLFWRSFMAHYFGHGWRSQPHLPVAVFDASSKSISSRMQKKQRQQRHQQQTRTGPILDYYGNLRHVETPCLVVTSAGDTFECKPVPNAHFTAALPCRQLCIAVPNGPAAAALPKDLLALGADLVAIPKKAPNHMGMGTHPSSKPLWLYIAQWLVLQEPQSQHCS